MIARLKAWLATLWADVKALLARSRTVWGLLIALLGFATEHVDELQSLAGAIGLSAWTPIAIGLGLALYARWSDHRGANPA